MIKTISALWEMNSKYLELMVRYDIWILLQSGEGDVYQKYTKVKQTNVLLNTLGFLGWKDNDWSLP